jgi:ankyrin repeat protein
MLLSAAASGTILFRTSLSFRVEYSLRDKSGNTPLHLSVKGGHARTVLALLEASKSLVPEWLEILNRLNGDGESALHLACRCNRADIVQILCSFGAYVRQAAPDGSTPLHMARSVDVVRVLLSHGAAADATDAQGNAPLHVFCKLMDAALVDEMCTHGASTFLRNTDGQTAFIIAADQEDESCASVLRNHHLRTVAEAEEIVLRVAFLRNNLLRRKMMKRLPCASRHRLHKAAAFLSTAEPIASDGDGDPGVADTATLLEPPPLPWGV